MRLPEFHYRTAAEPHPRADDLTSNSVLWAEGFQLITDEVVRRKVVAAQFGAFGGLTHGPQTPSITMQLISDFFHWLWLIDDIIIDKAEGGPEIVTPIVEHFVAVARCARTPASGPELAYIDLVRRLEAEHGRRSGARFEQATIRFLEALPVQSAMRASGSVPETEQYEVLRRGISGVPMALTFVECSSRRYVSDEEWYRADVQRLLELANDIISWVNDIFSLPMELEEQLVFWNYPLMLQARGMSMSAAVTETGKRAQRAYDDFWLLAEEIIPELSPACQALIRGVDRWMAGSYEWHRVTPRYWHAWEHFTLT
ncbi:terpene synthase family protein [Nocardia vinacea]|uniref:terpene synthase family protein n=1 Tax=Nocardia vinacea TaxID=96468 RepID=UPI0002FB4BCA|nr:terpene synthase family protein [Nocardia vinacea]